MKCQECDEQATHHVTDLVDGEPVEYHICEKHLENLNSLDVQNLKGLEPQAAASRRRGFPAVVEDPEILKVFTDSEAREKLVAYLLPVLCLALLDPKPEIRILSAIHFLYLGADARSAIQALRDALSDQDPRMRKVAEIVIESIETSGLRGRSS